MTFGARLRQLRAQRLLTQAELAALLGVHTSQIAHWEADRHRPRAGRQRQLCAVLGVTPDDLLGQDIRGPHQGTTRAGEGPALL